LLRSYNTYTSIKLLKKKLSYFTESEFSLRIQMKKDSITVDVSCCGHCPCLHLSCIDLQRKCTYALMFGGRSGSCYLGKSDTGILPADCPLRDATITIRAVES